MADQPSPSLLHAVFMQSLQRDLPPGVDARALSRFSVIGAGIAQMGVRTNLLSARAFDAALLDRCVGSEVDAYCAARGPVVRFPAAPSRGPATWRRATTTAGAGTIYAGTQFRVPYNGRSYVFRTLVDVTVKSTDTQVTVDAEALTAGADTNVGTQTLPFPGPGFALVDATLMFDATLVPTSLTVAGGADAESDAEMKARQRLYERSRQRATQAAVMFGALLVNGVKHVVAVDVRDPHVGVFCAVYVGDVNWDSTSTMRDAVAASIEDWRGMGSAIDVHGITQSDVTVAGVMRMERPIAFYDIAQLRAAGAQLALDYFDQRVDPSAYDVSLLKGRIARVHPEVASVSLTTPLSSVASSISPSSIKLTGLLPATLTRYRTRAPLITLDVEGPT